MSHNSTATPAASSRAAIIVAYYSLTVTVLGTIFNLLTFIILCRPTFRKAKIRPTLHYMRAMAIFDILMLYGRNLDHYLVGVHYFTIQRLTIPLCRFLSFFNYFVLQSSAWLRVFVCLDRYLSLSRLHKTWFSNPKHVLLVIGCIIGTLIVLNSIFLFYGCSFEKNGTINGQSWAFELYPMWDYVHLAVYNALPFLLMSLFNAGVIYHLIHLRRVSTVQHSQIQHRAISITLVITTVLFLLMTLPVTVAFAFFYTEVDLVLGRYLDALLYTYNIICFPLYMITFDEFRRECLAVVTCRKDNRRVALVTATQLRSINVV